MQPWEEAPMPPSTRSSWIPVHRLVSGLRRVRPGCVVSIVAGAGQGKTEALTHWHRSSSGRVIHIQLATADAGTLESAIMRSFDYTTRAQVRPRPTTMWEALSGENILLQLDNLELLTDDADRALVSDLIARTPSRLILVLSGRTDAGLDLAPARAGRRLVTFGPDDFLLHADDLQAWSPSLTADEAEAAIVLSGGWAPAIPLALAKVRRTGAESVELLTVRTLIKNQVLSPLESDLRALLADVHVLGRADADLLDAVGPRKDAGRWISVVCERPVPLVVVDSDDMVHVHPLIGEQAALEAWRVEPGHRERVVERAIATFVVRDQHDRAVDLLAEIGDREALARLVYDQGRFLALQGRTAEVRCWLERFTSRELAQYPELQMLTMLLDGTDATFGAVEAWLALLEERDLGPVVNLDLQNANPIALIRGLLGAPDTADAEALPPTAGWWGLISQVNTGCEALQRGDLTTAGGIFQMLGHFSKDFPVLEVWRASSLAFHHIQAGDARAGLDVLEKATPDWERSGLLDSPLTYGMDSALSACHALAGHRSQAEHYLQRALAKIPLMEEAIPLRASMALLCTTEAALVLGKPHLAESLLLRFRVCEAGQQPALVVHAERLQRRLDEGGHGRSALLSTSELAILKLLDGPQTVPAIAEILGRSPATVRTHIRAIYHKLGVNSRASAVEQAHAAGLLIRTPS